MPAAGLGNTAPERRAWTGGTVSPFNPSSPYGKKGDNGAVFEGSFSIQPDAITGVHCGRPRGHLLACRCGWQPGTREETRGNARRVGVYCLRKAEGPLLQEDRLPTPSWRQRTLETLPSRSRCGGRIGRTVQAILAVGRLMGYSGPGTPGRWAVSRETFPKLLEINQPPSPLALLVPSGACIFPSGKFPCRSSVVNLLFRLFFPWNGSCAAFWAKQPAGDYIRPSPPPLSYACASKSEHPSRRIHRGDVAATFESPSADLVARPAALGFPLVLHSDESVREKKEQTGRYEVEEHGKAVQVSCLGRGEAYREKRERERRDRRDNAPHAACLAWVSLYFESARAYAEVHMRPSR